MIHIVAAAGQLFLLIPTQHLILFLCHTYSTCYFYIVWPHSCQVLVSITLSAVVFSTPLVIHYMSIIPLLVSFFTWTCLPTQRHLGVHNLISANWFNSHVFRRLPHYSNVKQCTTVVLKWWNYLIMKMLRCWIVQLANGQADCKQYFPFSFVIWSFKAKF